MLLSTFQNIFFIPNIPRGCIAEGGAILSIPQVVYQKTRAWIKTATTRSRKGANGTGSRNTIS